MKNSIVNVPDYALKALKILETSGFEAYLAGGCIRDSLLGRVPHDWDITTNALPEQVMESFGAFRVIPTGLKHGTVSVIIDNELIEITTYRLDGEYSDNRRPDSVTFTGRLIDDLARRDFTVNAFAWNPKDGLVDFFDGVSDLENKIIRCVGNPKDRFNEDALRIMRGVRFASELGFKIEPATLNAMAELKALLDNISYERIGAELSRAVMGTAFTEVFMKTPEILLQIIPEMQDCAGFNQKSKYHIYDVYEHILVSVGCAENDLQVRLAMLFHDIAKPESFKMDEDGEGHFKGHPQKSAKTAEAVLKRLRYDNHTIERVALLIFYHDTTIPCNEKGVKRWLSKIGEQAMRQLLCVKTADDMAKNPDTAKKRQQETNTLCEIIDKIIEQEQCYSLKDLAVNGSDLINAGIPSGKIIGRILEKLLNMVIDSEVENEKAALLQAAAEILTKLD